MVDDSTITSHIKRIRRKFAAVDPALRPHSHRLRHGLPVAARKLTVRLPALGLRSRIALVALALTRHPLGGLRLRAGDGAACCARTRSSNSSRPRAAWRPRSRTVPASSRRRPRPPRAPRRRRARPPSTRGSSSPASRAPGLRIWVVDNKLQLVAVAGDLKGPPPAAPGSVTFGPLERVVHLALRPLFERLHATAPARRPRNSSRATSSSAGASSSARSTARRRGAAGPLPAGARSSSPSRTRCGSASPSWAPSWSRRTRTPSSRCATALSSSSPP